MGLQKFPINDYTGGVNLKDGPIALEPNEAQEAYNVIVTTRGVLKQREGKTRLDGSGFPAAKRADHARPWYHGETRVLMLSIDGSVYYMTTGGALTLLFAGTAGTVWCFEQMEYNPGTGYKDYLWMMNGVDKPQKWDGTTLSEWKGKPPNGTMLRVWKNRMCISGVAKFPQRVFYSEVANPEKPEDETNGGYGTNFIDIRTSEDDLDPVTWFEIIEDNLLIFKKRSVNATVDDATFSFRRLADVGCEDRFQSCVLFGKAYFFNRAGVYSVNTQGLTLCESINLDPMFFDEGPVRINQSALSKVRMAVTRDRRVLAAVPTNGSATNNIIIEAIPELVRLNPRRESRRLLRTPWMLHELPASSLCTFRVTDDDELVGGAADAAKMYRFFTGLTDDGVAINSRWFSGWKSLIAEENLERIRRVNVELEGRCVVEVYKDFNASVPRFAKILESSTDPKSEWDDGEVWDDGKPWDPIGGTELRRVRPESRGRYHAIRITNNVLETTWEIDTIELAYRGGKEITE